MRSQRGPAESAGMQKDGEEGEAEAEASRRATAGGGIKELIPRKQGADTG